MFAVGCVREGGEEGWGEDAAAGFVETVADGGVESVGEDGV